MRAAPDRRLTRPSRPAPRAAADPPNWTRLRCTRKALSAPCRENLIGVTGLNLRPPGPQPEHSRPVDSSPAWLDVARADAVDPDPSGAASRARTLVSITMAAFATEYAPIERSPTTPACEATSTGAPGTPRCRMRRIPLCARKNEPSTLIAIVCDQSSGEVSISGLTTPHPAQATSSVTGPKRASATSNACSVASRLRTSAATNSICPSVASARHASSPLQRSRPVTTTPALASSKRCAVRSPSPDVPPLTSAVRPFRSATGRSRCGAGSLTARLVAQRSGRAQRHELLADPQAGSDALERAAQRAPPAHETQRHHPVAREEPHLVAR
jgi:hypothetical protein